MQNSRQAYVNLALATVAFAVAFAVWGTIAPLSHQIQADFNLDNTSIGLLIALPALLGALMRVRMGILTDRYGCLHILEVSDLGQSVVILDEKDVAGDLGRISVKPSVAWSKSLPCRRGAVEIAATMRMRKRSWRKRGEQLKYPANK